MEAGERPGYPVYSCSDAVDAHAIAVKANILSEAQPWPLLSQVLTGAMVERYAAAGACTTTTLQQSELQYAEQLSRIAYQHQVGVPLHWSS